MSINSLLMIFLLSYGIYAYFNSIKFWLIYFICILLYYLLTSLTLFSHKQINISKKINYTSWTNNYDPQTYTTIKLDNSLFKTKKRRIENSFNSNYFRNKINVNYIKKISRSIWLY